MSPRDILRRATGLDPDEATLERALHLRMKALGLKERADYPPLLSGPELDELAELIVIPESWMFRDPAAFEAALALARARLARRPGHLVRILSLPCAGGEEPYSMAMALRDGGVPLEQCRIDGIDLSAASIARARAAHYTRNAFRGAHIEFRDRHFTRVDDGYLLRDEIRQAVHFSQGNLFELDMAANAGRYDVVFCRNLLIYFDDAGIARAAAVLAALLAQDGILLAGPAETTVLCRHGFTQLPHSGAFALRRSPVPPRTPPRPRLRAPAPVPMPAAPAAATASIPPPAAPPLAPAELLARAQRHARNGQLDEAAADCHALLAADATIAGAYFILAQSSRSRGDTAGVERYLRQCVYLEPRHHAALCALALLAEQAGEHDKAVLYRRRADRDAAAAQGSSGA
jgi:chemotaxis protein methyltransferase WspC